MSTDDLIEAVRLYCLERFPRRPAVRFTVVLIDGEKIKMSIPDVPCRPPTAPNGPGGAASGNEKVYPAERRVLDAVAGMEKENPTGEEIAEAAGMTEYTGFRALLHAMRRNGRLGGKAGTDAYPITAKGWAALEPPGTAE